MARIESCALGGFYATPPHLMPRIAALLGPYEGEADVSFLDPCAGEGEAVVELAKLLCPSNFKDVDIFGCELEVGRHETAVKNKDLHWRSAQQILLGDAFRITFNRGDKAGISVLYLNPPYDTDPVHGRLEQRFLERFTATLADDGVLLFVVPHYALKASSELLAREFTDVRCFRFPSEDFGAFKQVVLFAKKSGPLFDPDPKLVALVQEWAKDPLSMPELPEVGAEPICQVPTARSWKGGLGTWDMKAIDVLALLRDARPWHQTSRGGALVPVPGIMPGLPVQDMLLRKYPLATPPRPAHIAAGIASGLFNGSRLEPNDKGHLPPILVKGCFDKEYRDVEEKRNKDGEIRGIVQIQQPKLVTTILDLQAHKYYTLQAGTERSAAPQVSTMNVADLIANYGESMMGTMERQCPILYDPRRDAGEVTIPASPRRLFTAQAHAVRALVKLLGGQSTKSRKGKAAILLGEIGSGKSSVAIMTASSIGAKRILVMCPPHLLTSWVNEVAATNPTAKVVILRTVEDLDALKEEPSDQVIIAVLSREVAKLTHGWEGAGPTCPRCGSPTPLEDLAKKRSRCGVQRLVAADGLAKVTQELATMLAPYLPQEPTIANVLRGRFAAKMLRALGSRKDKPTFPGVQAGSLDGTVDLLVAKFIANEGELNDIQKAIVLSLLAAGDDERVLAVLKKVRGKLEGGYWTGDFARELTLLLTPGDPRQTAIIDEEIHTASSWIGASWHQLRQQITEAAKGEIKTGAGQLSWETGKLTIDGAERGSLAAIRKAFFAIGKTSSFKWTSECGEFLFQATPDPRRVSLARHVVRFHPELFDFLVLDECFVAGTLVSGRPIETVRVGDLVDSYDEATKRYVRAVVTRIWIKIPTSLVRVKFSDGRTFVCTPNHPVLTPRGWISAGLLNTGELVYALQYAGKTTTVGGEVQTMRCSHRPAWPQGDPTKDAGLRLLQRSVWPSGSAESTQGVVVGNLQPMPQAGRPDGSIRSRATEPGVRLLLANMLSVGEECWNRASEQDRPGGHDTQDRHRGGWANTQAIKVEVPGSAQGGGLAVTRVDGVEVLERGSDGRFGGVCPDGLVYNLEVAGTHTYFAEGVLVHNCHEYSTDGSAQERSAHRLTSLGIPTVVMTGSIMNGYAESLFANVWALSGDFRSEFARDERQKFIDRYGYRKRIIEDRDKGTGQVVEYGSNSDRIERSERVIGNAPGLLPLFLLRHLLPVSVTLHKADLAIDLPACRQEMSKIQPTAALLRKYQRLQQALINQIRHDQFSPELAGRLWGQLAELPSYLDRATADTGNVDGGAYEIRYPESAGGDLVVSEAPLPAGTLLPKEAWMLDRVERELAEGRRCMVFCWHVALLPRIARLIEQRIGQPVPILHASKVPTAKRQDWIDREVVRKDRQVLVTNPVAIQTGLNNLVHFASEVWMENPACNPVTYRQAIGRVDRIGQKLETRIMFPVYEGTLQETLYDLLMKKVAVSVSTDGLDPESALQAAGVGEDEYLAGLSIGKALWLSFSEAA